jgi:hypothetical protein
MIIRAASALLCSLVLTAASVWVPTRSDERAMYGHEGPVQQNWLPRKLAGWPAPYLADNPNTSVPNQIGPEDDFRPGPFLGTLSFWLLVSLATSGVLALRRSRARGESSLDCLKGRPSS